MQEEYGTRFFSPLLPGFNKKPLIPQELAKNICADDTRKVATIVTCGKIWQVEFYKEMGDYYIGGEGWENFVEAHGLKDYDMLVFRYRSNMVFSLRIFDKTTCCEKTYHYGSCIRESTVFSDHDNDEKPNHVVQKPTKSSCKKRKAQELNHTTISEELSQDQVTAEEEGNCSRKKLSFEKTIKSRHLTGGKLFMGIPSEFLEPSGRDHGEFMLRDPRGQTWPVTLHKCKPFGTYMSKGWLEFARGNKLKEGDRCTFALTSQQWEKRLIDVKIPNNNPVRKIDRASRMPKSAPVTVTRGAHFEVTIAATQLSRYSLYVPKSFRVATCLEKLSQVILVDPEHRRWSFGLRHNPNHGNTDTYLTRSWRQFVVSNRLRGGDKCVFELVKEEEDSSSSSSSVIGVQILRVTKQE